MVPVKEGRARRLSNAVLRARIAIASKYRSRSPMLHEQAEAHFDRLPVELIALIFSQVELSDLLSLRNTSRSFYDIIDQNDSLIIRQYVLLHGLVELSLLFPPSPCPITGNPRYDLRYLTALVRRERICLDLSGYLAEKILERGTGIPVARMKRTRSVTETLLQTDLSKRMIHVLYFLTEYSRRRIRAENALTTHRHLMSSLSPTDRTVPIPDVSTQAVFHTIQLSIIDSFSDTILIHTHHIMVLMIKYLRVSICPEPPHQRNDPWIAMLLQICGLERIKEYFAADMPYAVHSTRKHFAKQMQNDFDSYEIMPGDQMPAVKKIWFDAAVEVMKNRHLEGHLKEGIAEGRWYAGIVIDDLSCTGCVTSR